MQKLPLFMDEDLGRSTDRSLAYRIAEGLYTKPILHRVQPIRKLDMTNPWEYSEVCRQRPKEMPFNVALQYFIVGSRESAQAFLAGLEESFVTMPHWYETLVDPKNPYKGLWQYDDLRAYPNRSGTYPPIVRWFARRGPLPEAPALIDDAFNLEAYLAREEYLDEPILTGKLSHAIWRWRPSLTTYEPIRKIVEKALRKQGTDSVANSGFRKVRTSVTQIDYWPSDITLDESDLPPHIKSFEKYWYKKLVYAWDCREYIRRNLTVDEERDLFNRQVRYGLTDTSLESALGLIPGRVSLEYSYRPYVLTLYETVRLYYKVIAPKKFRITLENFNLLNYSKGRLFRKLRAFQEITTFEEERQHELHPMAEWSLRVSPVTIYKVVRTSLDYYTFHVYFEPHNAKIRKRIRKDHKFPSEDEN